MESASDSFQHALEKFKRRLTREEEEEFKFVSLEDVLVELDEIQTKQGLKKELMNLPRIRGFLQVMSEYGKVVEVFLNASSILCFVWGPMKFCLQVGLHSPYSIHLD
jgi:hypothetical protein